MRSVTRAVKQGTAVVDTPSINVFKPGTTEVSQCLCVDRMKSIDNVLRGDALTLSGHGDWRPVFIGTRDHEHPPSSGAFVPVLNVRREVATGHVTKVQWPVGVGPRHANQHVVRGGHRTAALGHIT